MADFPPTWLRQSWKVRGRQDQGDEETHACLCASARTRGHCPRCRSCSHFPLSCHCRCSCPLASRGDQPLPMTDVGPCCRDRQQIGSEELVAAVRPITGNVTVGFVVTPRGARSLPYPSASGFHERVAAVPTCKSDEAGSGEGRRLSPHDTVRPTGDRWESLNPMALSCGLSWHRIRQRRGLRSGGRYPHEDRPVGLDGG